MEHARNSADPELYRLRCDYVRDFPLIKRDGDEYRAVAAAWRYELYADTVADLRRQIKARLAPNAGTPARASTHRRS